MKTFSVILFYIFFIIICSLTGLLFDLHEGAIIGAVLAVIVLLIIFKYGEKFILLFAKARYITDDEQLVDQLKNFCTHLGVSEIKVYWSNVYYNNVYYVNSYMGTPSIIIGKEVYNQLTKNELASLLYATLLRLKTKDSKHKSIVNLITLFLFWWVFLIVKYTKNKTLKEVFETFLYPAFFIRSYIYSNPKEVEVFDNAIFMHENLKRDYISAIFKINKMPMCLPLSVGSFSLSGLSHTYNNSDEPFLYSLIQNEMPIEERVKIATDKLNEF